MYNPTHFKNTDVKKSLEIIRDYPLATMISVLSNNTPFISHIPIAPEEMNDKLHLIGHMSKANPHWKQLDNKFVYLVFHGPNHYISPNWYIKNDVPTWNYAVVHVEGTARLIQDHDGIKNCLKKLSAQVESNQKNKWDFWIPDDLQDSQLEKHIIGFHITVDKIDSKFKLSQNKSIDDRKKIITELENSNDDSSHSLLKLMNEIN